jgi:hypothetical protein
MKLILITLVAVVVGLALACTATPTPTPPPSLSTERAIDIVQTHLKTKKVAGNTCWNMLGLVRRWRGDYDSASNKWDIYGSEGYSEQYMRDNTPLDKTGVVPNRYHWTLDDSTREIGSRPNKGSQNKELGC